MSRLLCLFFLIVIIGYVSGFHNKAVIRSHLRNQKHKHWLKNPLWATLAKPTEAGKAHCLCGWLYFESSVYWVLLKDQVDDPVTDCSDLCKASEPAGLKVKKRLKLCDTYMLKKTVAWTKAFHDTKSPCVDFFTADSTLESWEGGFAKVASITQNIHFFWWGVPTQAYKAQALDAADSWATKMKGKAYKINYWAQHTATLITEHAFPKDTGVTVKTIGTDGTFATIGDILTGTDLSGSKAEFNTVVGKIAAVKQFAALKDLAVLAILYKEGGYFFDTTVTYTGTNDIVTTLDSGARQLKCPVYPLEPKKNHDGCFDIGDGQGNALHYEVNLMYHFKGSKATKTIFTDLLATWSNDNYGLTTEIARIQAQNWEDTQKKSKINEIIGNAVTAATSVGMKKCIQENFVEAKYTGWDVKKAAESDVPEGKSGIVVDDVGVTKIYMGTGR